MSRILVANDARTVYVEVRVDRNGYGQAECEADRCPWATEPGRFDFVRDVIDEAGTHLDQEHQ